MGHHLRVRPLSRNLCLGVRNHPLTPLTLPQPQRGTPTATLLVIGRWHCSQGKPKIPLIAVTAWDLESNDPALTTLVRGQSQHIMLPWHTHTCLGVYYCSQHIPKRRGGKRYVILLQYLSINCNDIISIDIITDIWYQININWYQWIAIHSIGQWPYCNTFSPLFLRDHRWQNMDPFRRPKEGGEKDAPADGEVPAPATTASLTTN